MIGSLEKPAYHNGMIDAVQEPDILRLQSRLQDANSRLEGLIESLERVGDRLYGPIPRGVSGAKGSAPEPSGTVHYLEAVIDATHVRIDAIQEAFNRIERL